jgi:hypothetical protein
MAQWICNCEGPSETHPNGISCNIHQPINDHMECCDNPACLICHPEQIPPCEVRDMFFWMQPADCCKRPRVVCAYEPCRPPRENEITRSGFDYDFASEPERTPIPGPLKEEPRPWDIPF